MPRRRERDDEYDIDERPVRKQGVPVWVVVVAGLFLVAVASGLGVSLVFRLAGPPVKPMTRDEFRQAVTGKTEAEVIEVLGNPDGTQDGSRKLWYYHRRTYDPVTRRTDSHAQIGFATKSGRVDAVNFY